MTSDQTALAHQIVKMVLAGIHREYPNHVSLLLESDDDLAPPRKMTPAFFGCLDWHSSVHSHWSLVRWLKRQPQASLADTSREALAQSLTEANITAELAFISRDSRRGFERPYGIAWFMQLVAELHDWDHAEACIWRDRLRPIETLCAERLISWVEQLTHPIRGGEHSQSAFAFGLFLDWADLVGNSEFADRLRQHCRRLYESDRDYPFQFEPSGHDFLSSGLAEADLMRRVLEQSEFPNWLDGFVPHLIEDLNTVLVPVSVSNRRDGKLAHLDGLNLSRSWMMDGIASTLPIDDHRRHELVRSSRIHAESGIANTFHDEYMSAHWLGSFATYLLTSRGISSAGNHGP